jgi:DNA repair photolyase
MGCAYCYARPTHEYLGFSAGLDFESKILIKENAAELLRQKFMSRAWTGELIVLSGNTDCYQPLERKFELTRRLLEVFLQFRNPVSIITKNQLVTRDIDLLTQLAALGLIHVTLSLTTLDSELAADLEPRTSRPTGRLAAVHALANAGVPTGINIAPVIPGLNDFEIPGILKAAKDHGAQWAGYSIVRLPHAVEPLFMEWLENKRPLKKEKILCALKDVRGGHLNDGQFATRMKGHGVVAKQIEQMFKIYRVKFGLDQPLPDLRTDLFRKITDQMSFFE